jgi:MFS family permease
MTERTLFYAVGMVLGFAIGGGIGSSFVERFGRRKVLPYLLAFSIVTGLVLGWAINEWLAFYRASATLGF